MLKDRIKNFYASLRLGDTETLAAVFTGERWLDTPLQGEVIGATAFEQFVQEQQAWLTQYKARSELLALTATDERLVAEYVLYLQKDGKLIDLPVALAADLVEGGVFAIRVYHSTWPLTGGHIIRTPMLKPVAGLNEPEVVEKYMAGLAEADIEAVLALFVEDGYAREPSGSEFKYAGPEGLRTFYGAALGGGGISLKHCTATFDGMRCAIEFICDEWANVKLPPQAGLAVYELAETDKLQAARIYDDVTPPFE